MVKKIVLWIILSIGIILNQWIQEVLADNQYIIYSNAADWLLYKKSATDTSTWTAITSTGAEFPVYSPDWLYIIYRNTADWLLYKKSATDTSNGSAITISPINDIANFTPIIYSWSTTIINSWSYYPTIADIPWRIQTYWLSIINFIVLVLLFLSPFLFIIYVFIRKINWINKDLVLYKKQKEEWKN
jgi:hypothetical protein